MSEHDVLDVVEQLTDADASPSRLFAAEGVGIGGWRRKRANNDLYRFALVDAAKFVSSITKGRRHPHYLAEAMHGEYVPGLYSSRVQESMSTSDFPLLFGDIIDRQVLGFYAETPVTWPRYVRRGTVRDFRTVNRFAVTGGEGQLEVVPELTEYPAGKLGEERYQLSVVKYGKRMPFSWETMINDDLDLLTSTPERFGRGSRRTEEKKATTLFADANGPHASLYTSGAKNIINQANGAAANNPPLSLAGVQDGLTVLSKLVDSDGEPIVITAVELVVPPALMVVGNTILNAVQLEWGLVGQGANAAPAAETRMITRNWLAGMLNLNVNYYLPIVSSTANGNTAWYLFASTESGRPAVELDFLIGHEQPEIFMKTPNAVRVGGGALNPTDGDFDSDSIEYKIRHVLGGGRLDPKATVASNGSGA